MEVGAFEDAGAEGEELCTAVDEEDPEEGETGPLVDDGTEDEEGEEGRSAGSTVRTAYTRVSAPARAAMNEIPDSSATGTPTSTPVGGFTVHNGRA
ncbi:hypothetical protein [Yimella sp. cx-51]|uniref:hypothetical protein n=1 Tax=Yimella sp. cx-51 TaxID=2770551 RepID=UPI00165D6863|nr:hypothetical protein [Yimella sp. cx-51]MBC9958356.1 hypothetical protein [Yimella sp. cx-51]QTH39738.1 hypothetical protein J5M86_15285 [Yimella sp. cx-51]